MKKILVKIEYDGTQYKGWQIQPDVVTVEALFKRTLRTICQREVDMVACSRTDSGVHAFGQLVTIRVPKLLPIKKLFFSINSLLPDDIAITNMVEVPINFSIRKENSGKRYVYRIYNSPIKPVKNRQYYYWVKKPLNFLKMERESRQFIGTHDFSAFRGKRCKQSSPIKTIHDIRVSYEQLAQTTLITVTIEGSGFLKNMVRIMVGSLIDIGSGFREKEIIDKALLSKKRCDAGATAPSKGLCLEEIFVTPDPFEGNAPFPINHKSLFSTKSP